MVWPRQVHGYILLINDHRICIKSLIIFYSICWRRPDRGSYGADEMKWMLRMMRYNTMLVWPRPVYGYMVRLKSSNFSLRISKLIHHQNKSNIYCQNKHSLDAISHNQTCFEFFRAYIYSYYIPCIHIFVLWSDPVHMHNNNYLKM